MSRRPNRLQAEMREAVAARIGVRGAHDALTQAAADAAYTTVEPLLKDILQASTAHRFMPDLDRAINRVEAALGRPE